MKSRSPQEWEDSVLPRGANGASERLPLPCPLIRALVTAGAGPACALCSEEGRDLWPSWPRGLPFIILPHTCLPSLTLIPLFFSSCLHGHTASLCLPSCTSDHQAPPSPVQPAPGPRGSQPVVSFKSSMTPC